FWLKELLPVIQDRYIKFYVNCWVPSSGVTRAWKERSMRVVHHTNPVGTEWRWKMDQPEMILQEAIENHQNMIKQFKGVSGVQAARFEEAMTAKHCALSLVGEPIMYPEINLFVRLLHQHSISTFLVTNAQFPDEIRNLEPVTQLYVSVDASTKESLKRIDRPLFKDFWQRFLDSLKALSEKQQRTVYRLTLVKAWNVDELKAYADLISLGKPDFIEVKGVTYCGKSSASNLTMANVPWHEEVVHFVQELTNLIPDYEIACEHEHSNCLLIAHKKVRLTHVVFGVSHCSWLSKVLLFLPVQDRRRVVHVDRLRPLPGAGASTGAKRWLPDFHSS
uniref:Uncharacterized protein n=1 Tax=Amazona collaria TaxID=241587 RepID=A0A8B9FE99_9PSIT